MREPAVPMVALDYAFTGGANADPAGKPGFAHLLSSLLDEGAGELDAIAFQERMEEKAIQLGFVAGRDHFRGSLRSLTANLDDAVYLLRLALTAPRFEAEAVERIRSQSLAALNRASTNPNDIANKRWWATAFPDHPYGQPSNGTPESLAAITADDLQDLCAQRVRARYADRRDRRRHRRNRRRQADRQCVRQLAREGDARAGARRQDAGTRRAYRRSISTCRRR